MDLVCLCYISQIPSPDPPNQSINLASDRFPPPERIIIRKKGGEREERQKRDRETETKTERQSERRGRLRRNKKESRDNSIRINITTSKPTQAPPRFT